jgi:hypothetical protein
MEQIMTAVSAQKSSFHSRAAAATVADVMRPPPSGPRPSGSSSSRSPRSMRSACRSRPGAGTGPWTHIAVLARERWTWCVRRSVRHCIRMSLRVLDGRPGAPLDSPQYLLVLAEGRGSGGTRK